jgi:hypothetical protein
MMLLLAVIVGLGLFLAWRLGVPKKLLALIPARRTDPTIAAGWTIGPIVNGENRSPRAYAFPHPEAIIAVEIPHGTVGDRIGELSGLTFVHGPLAGKSRIIARFRVEGEDGVKIIPSQPGPIGWATPFFQRRGDNWGAQGKYEAYRWFATHHTKHLVVGEEYEMSAPLDHGWTATQTSTQINNPAGFHDALANAESVGIVFGGGDGYAHGICATGPARFVLLDFQVI